MTNVVTLAAHRESPVLALPGDVTETTLVLPDGLTFDEWEDVGKRLRQAEKSVRWWIGDWLAYGERTYGETYTRAAEVTGYTVGDLRNMVAVSTAIDPSHRCDALTWSHHREVASLEPEEQVRWLDKAQTEGWSKRELHEQSRLSRPAAEEPPETPPTHAPKCSRCGHACPVCEIDMLGSGKKKRGKR
jgi:hypothetical protein